MDCNDPHQRVHVSPHLGLLAVLQCNSKFVAAAASGLETILETSAYCAVVAFQALQGTIEESIASRQLQQELDRQGYLMGQLDAIFASGGVFSTEKEVVSAETPDPDQVQPLVMQSASASFS